MTKLKAILTEGIILIITILIVYCGISFGLGGDFALPVNTTKDALLMGMVLGILLVLITLPCLIKETKIIQRTGLILGIVAQILLFFGFAIYSSMGASV